MSHNSGLMFDRLRRFLPDRHALANNRWLRWLGPSLLHPALWRFSRRGVAMGVALGVFFGFLVPLGQIPLSATAAVVLRANVPTAVASTLVTNPVTFAPIYYAAYQFGHWVVGEPAHAEPPPLPDHSGHASGHGNLWQRISGMGKPLLVGLISFAIGFGALVYALTTWIWIWRIRRKRRMRLEGPKRVM